MEQREIKFIGWMPSLKRFTHPCHVEDMAKILYYGSESELNPDTSTSVSEFATSVDKWLQYTGQSDKHKRDIYEGFYVFDGSSVYVVEYCNQLTSFQLRQVAEMRDGGFHHMHGYGTRSLGRSLVSSEMDLEIVGNIFQNPNLEGIKIEGKGSISEQEEKWLRMASCISNPTISFGDPVEADKEWFIKTSFNSLVGETPMLIESGTMDFALKAGLTEAEILNINFGKFQRYILNKMRSNGLTEYTVTLEDFRDFAEKAPAMAEDRVFKLDLPPESGTPYLDWIRKTEQELYEKHARSARKQLERRNTIYMDLRRQGSLLDSLTDAVRMLTERYHDAEMKIYLDNKAQTELFSEIKPWALTGDFVKYLHTEGQKQFSQVELMTAINILGRVISVYLPIEGIGESNGVECGKWTYYTGHNQNVMFFEVYAFVEIKD